MSNYLVITGASRGIGCSSAQQFVQQGWQVINLSRSPCPINGVINLTIDLTEPDWHIKHAEALLSHLKNAARICLVHNAGVCFRDRVTNLSGEQLRLVLELNVVAPALLNQLLLPLMLPGSSIVYIGSTLAEKAVPNTASYVVSKHALAGLMKATCQDLDNSGIHTCCICPGITDTEMLRERIQHSPQVLQALQHKVTAHRLIEPQEIADVVWFCANHPVINGAVLHAHLGQLES